MGPDERWEHVIRQVEDALDQLQLAPGPARDALIVGVREALANIQSGDVEVRVTTSAHEGGLPQIAVVEGGRRENDPPSERQPPDLWLAEPETVEEPLLGVHRMHVGHDAPTNGDDLAHVQLPAGGWRTVLHAAQPRAYRLGCVEGGIEVEADGQTIDLLDPAQTLDVEARTIRVGAAHGSGAQAWYRRL